MYLCQVLQIVQNIRPELILWIPQEENPAVLTEPTTVGQQRGDETGALAGRLSAFSQL